MSDLSRKSVNFVTRKAFLMQWMSEECSRSCIMKEERVQASSRAWVCVSEIDYACRIPTGGMGEREQIFQKCLAAVNLPQMEACPQAGE